MRSTSPLWLEAEGGPDRGMTLGAMLKTRCDILDPVRGCTFSNPVAMYIAIDLFNIQAANPLEVKRFTGSTDRPMEHRPGGSGPVRLGGDEFA